LEIFHGATLIHFTLFLIYSWFALSIITSGKLDMQQVSVSAIIAFVGLWALGKSVICYKNNGIGISREYHSSIFDLFTFQLTKFPDWGLPYAGK
jgi:hypothetical protein